MKKRICCKVSDLSWLEERSLWTRLKTAFSVKRIISTSDKTTEEVSYYISSQDVSAKELLFISREHWKIESMHCFCKNNIYQLYLKKFLLKKIC